MYNCTKCHMVIGYLCKMEDGHGVEADPADGDGHHEDALHQEGGGEQALVNHHNLVLSTWSQSVFEQNGSFSSCSTCHLESCVNLKALRSSDETY